MPRTQNEYARLLLTAYNTMRATCPTGDKQAQFKLVVLWYPLWTVAQVGVLPDELL